MSIMPQLLFDLIISIALVLTGIKIEEVTATQIELFITLSSVALSPLLILPILKKLFIAKDYSNVLSRCSIKTVKASYTVLTVALIFTLEFFFDFLMYLFSIPVDTFTNELKHFMNSIEETVLVIVAVCIVAPLVEEMIFRGWLFDKLIQTNLGNMGTVIFTSLLFTVLHFQNQNAILLVFIFISGLLLAGIRLKTGNTTYSIIAHITTNAYVLFVPVWFIS